MKTLSLTAGLALAGLVLAAGLPRASHAITVGFEALPSGECGAISPPFASDGMTFTATATTCINTATPVSNSFRFSANGTQTLGIVNSTNGAQTLTMARSNSAAFDLISIDVAELFEIGDFAFANNAETVTVTGTTSGSGTVSQTFTLDGFSDGPGGSTDFETFAFSSSFTDLLSVSFSAISLTTGTAYYLIDNVVYAGTPSEPTVSEPGMIAVLGLGLTVLGFHRRRRAA
jgi:hypothetical protein